MEKRHFIRISTLVIFILGLVCIPSTVMAQSSEEIQELRRLIEIQRKQLEAQQRRIKAQEKKFAAQEQTLLQLQTQINMLAAEKRATAPAPADKVVTSGGGERVKLALSGHVSRMVNIVDDGKNRTAYHVDNDNSESRVNLVGTAQATDDLTIGSRIELSIAPNKSGIVSQDNEEDNNNFDQRWAEVSFDSQQFGKLSIGKGATASYGSASVDLSGTAVIAYATIADTAGGMQFRQSSDDALTDIRIGDAFNSFDGLNRRNRLRYDSPALHGFRFATSAVSDQRYDAAVYWGGQGYGFKAAGAAAFADPNEENADLQYDGSFSLLHEKTGLNLTMSAGLQERDGQSDAQNYYVKGGWLTNLFSVGETAFAVDYTRSLNLPNNNDEGYSVGVAGVQLFEKLGTEIFLQYRLHSLDRDAGPSVQDIGVGSFGTRVKF